MKSKNLIGSFLKSQRRAAGLSQKEFALRAGLGLRFVRDLEQGKETVRLDKVNQALGMFGYQAVPGRTEQ
ncbi:MAG: helix-turn-helix domain-containing protein [Spirochaetia bacterium]